MIRLIRREADWDKLAQIEAALKSRSLPARLLRRGALAELEPAISASVIGGLLHESDADIGDPLHVSRALLARFIADGGALRRETAIALIPSVDGAEVITEGGRLAASQVFVTAGLQSGALLRPLGVVAPLQAERGYHLMLNGWGDLLTRPVTFQSESCVATPMGADLRLAGTVEFAREADTPDWSRAECLESYARRYFDSDLVGPSSSRWIGSRPSLPDSLPAIGRVRGAPAIGYAFGHQHLGVTQAAISARLLCEIMDGATPSLDCGPYDVARFGKS
jgi:D-amino-acid dehydrogenase